MKVQLMLGVGAAILLLSAGSANAACSDEIASLERALTGTSGTLSASDLSKISPSAGTSATTDMGTTAGAGRSIGGQTPDAATTGAGTAKVLDNLRLAKQVLADGQETDCLELVDEAKQMMGILPQ